MSAEAPPPVLVHRDGMVAVVTLNRPGAINAFNETVRNAVPPLLAELDADSEVRAIVIIGAGDRGFCAGADIKELRTIGTPIEERSRLMPATWIEALDDVRKPVLAGIHGICLGGGLELALACDIRIASADARFGLPETALGLIPGGGGTQRLPRLIGLANALDLLLTGEPIGAEQALRMGLVTRVAETRDAMMAEVMRIAQLIAGRPPAAIACCKEAALASADADFATGLRLEKSLFALLSGTADRAEAAEAFREKRTPRFVGR